MFCKLHTFKSCGVLKHLYIIIIFPPESPFEKAYFDQWQKDNFYFVQTKAYKKVENKIKDNNLVIVKGMSGSGKSAIIQHIALKYRAESWMVKPVIDAREFKDAYLSGKMRKNKTIFVVNDPFGKESFDEMLYNSWERIEDTMKTCLQTEKIIMSCRSCVLQNSRVDGIFNDMSNIVDVNNGQLELTDDEKRQILEKYTSTFLNLSEEKRNEIVQNEAYFPLLCKLFSKNEKYQTDVARFFKEPVEVLREEIREYKNTSKEKYCALLLLSFFNDELCVENLQENELSKSKFQRALKLSEMEKNTRTSNVDDALNSLNGFLVKKLDKFQFYHDFVMEVTTNIFGTDHALETIKYADTGFLRKRVKIGIIGTEQKEPLMIYLEDKHIDALGKRLFSDISGERFLDVVLNPCLKNEKIIETIKQEIKHHPKRLSKLLEKKKQICEKELYSLSKHSKLAFVQLENEISPLYALIVFSHTDLSLFCLTTMKKMKIDITESTLFSAVCYNGSLRLFNFFSEDRIKNYLTEEWEFLHPVHILSMFHNYEILGELIKFEIDVNLKMSESAGGWTPLTLAAGSNTKENEDNNQEQSRRKRRYETEKILLNNGAKVNLCNKYGESPLHVACENDHNSTLQLLLNDGTNISSCPPSVGHENEDDGSIQLLLNYDADINSLTDYGQSPLHIACANGCDSIVQLLLEKKADINLRNNDGVSPLNVADETGHESTVQLLLKKGASWNNDGH